MIRLTNGVVDVTPEVQPTAVRWERPLIDHDGAGRPIYGAICKVTLSFDEGMSQAQFAQWKDRRTGSAYTVTLPNESGVATSYPNCYLSEIRGRLADLNVYEVEVVFTNVNASL